MNTVINEVAAAQAEVLKEILNGGTFVYPEGMEFYDDFIAGLQNDPRISLEIEDEDGETSVTLAAAYSFALHGTIDDNGRYAVEVIRQDAETKEPIAYEVEYKSYKTEKAARKFAAGLATKYFVSDWDEMFYGENEG